MPIPKHFTTHRLAEICGVPYPAAMALLSIAGAVADNPPGRERLWKYERLEELRAIIAPVASRAKPPVS